MYQRRLIKNPADFYNLKNRKSELKEIEGLGEKSISNLLNSIELSKKNTPSRLITSLGIPLLGRAKSKKMMKIYFNISDFIEAIERKELGVIEKELGLETQKEICAFFQKNKSLQNLKNLLAEIEN